jgi:hypothetical protein
MPTRTVVLARDGLMRAWRALGAVAVGGAFVVATWGAWTSNTTADDLQATRAAAVGDRAAAAVLGQSVDDLRRQVQDLGAEPVVPPASEQLDALPAATVTGGPGRDGRDGQVILVPAPAVTLSAPPGRDGRDGTNGTAGTNGVDGQPGAPGAPGTNATVTAPPVLLTATVTTTETVTPAPVVLTSTTTATTTEYSTVTTTVTAPPDPPPATSDPGTDVPTGEPTGAP